MMNLFQTIRNLGLAGVFGGCGLYGLHYVLFDMVRGPDVSPAEHMRTVVTYALGCVAALLLALFLVYLVLLQSEPIRRLRRRIGRRRNRAGE